MNVSIEIRGDKEIQRKLRKLGPSLLSFPTEMDEIGRLLAEYYASVGYGSQGQVFNQRWARLSPGYATWKAKHFPGRPPLERTGAMRKSFTHASNATSARISNTADYFKYHQSSASRSGKLPRRMLMAINDTNRRTIRDLIEQGVRKKIQEA